MANTLQLIIQAIDQASGTLDTIGKKGTGMSADLEKSFIKVGAALTGIGISAKLAADNINQAFLGFEGAMTEVKALGVATDELEKMRQKALDLSRDMPLAASDVADAMYLMVSVGWSAEEMMTAIEPASKLAVAGSVDLKDATNAVINAMEAYKDTGLTATQATEIFAKGVGVGKWELNDFLMEMMKNINVASELGIGFQELAAYNVALQNSFVDSSEAGSALKMMLMNLVEQQVIDKLGAMGVAVSDANGNFRGMIPIMSDLDDVLNAHYTEVERNTILTELFGARSVNAANALMRQKDELPGLIAEMGDASFMYDQFNTKVNSVGSQLQIANNRMEEAKIALGEAMVPATLAAAGAMSTFASVLTDLPGPLQTAVGGFLQFAQVLIPIGPLLMALPSLIGGVTAVAGGLSTGLAGMSAALTAGTVAVGGITIALGPLVLAIAGVVAAVAALYLAWESNFLGIQDIVGTFKDYAVDRFEGVKSAFGNMTSSLSPHVEKLKAAFGDLFGEINELFEKMTGGISISEALGKILEVVGKVVDTVLNVAFKALGGLIGILIDAISLFIEGLTSLVDWFGKVANHPIAVFFRETLFGAIKLVIEKIEAFCSAINTLVSNSDAMVSNIKAGWEGIEKTVSDKVSEMGQAFETFSTNAATAFEGLRTTIADKITDAILTAKSKFDEFVAKVNEVTAAIGKAFTDVVNKVKEILAPITKTFQDIINTITSALETVRKKFEEVFTDVVNKVKEILAPITKTFQDIINTITSALETVRKKFEEVFTDVVNKVKEILAPITKTFQDIINTITSALETVRKKFEEVFQPVIVLFDAVKSAIQKVIEKIIDLVNSPAVQAILQVIGGPVKTLAGIFGNELNPKIDETKGKIGAMGNEGTTSAGLIQTAAGKISGFLSGLTGPADTAKKGIENIGSAGNSMPGNISPGVEGTKSKINEIAATAKNVESTVNQTFAQIKTAAAQTAEYVAHNQSNASTSNYTGVVTDAQGNPVSVPAGYTSIGTANVDSYSKEVYTSGGKYYIKNASGGYQQVYDVGSVPGVLFSSTAQTAPGAAALTSIASGTPSGSTPVTVTGGGTVALSETTTAADVGSFLEWSSSILPDFIYKEYNTGKYYAVQSQGESGSVRQEISRDEFYTYANQGISDITDTANKWSPLGSVVKYSFPEVLDAYKVSSGIYARLKIGGSSIRIDENTAKAMQRAGINVQNLLPVITPMATGGHVSGEGWAMTGEHGPELQYMPKGASVVPLDQSKSIVDYDRIGEAVAAAVTRAIGSGVVRDLHLHGNFFGDEAAFRQLNRKLKSVNNMESVRTGV